MNFQTLGKVESPDFYIDVACRRAREKLDNKRETELKGKRKSRLDKSKFFEMLRMEVIRSYLDSALENITKSYPSLGRLPKFYHELVRCTLDYDEVKKSLGAVQWARNSIATFFFHYKNDIKATNEMEKINGYRRSFLGRASSVLRQIKDELAVLEHARRVMKEYPVIKTSLQTIAIVGFPNVGKTTLLYKLTGSKPDIASYPFTTIAINIGYIKLDDKKIQVLDTPGSLNRFNKMNNIEKIAFLAMKHVAEKLVYVFDLTEPYPLEKQVELYKIVKEIRDDVTVYLSKVDILGKEKLKSFAKKYDAVCNSEELKENLLNSEELKNKLLG